MTGNERDLVLLKEALDLIDLTAARLPVDRDGFLADLDKRDATTLRVHAIGEHLRAISDALRSAHTDVPWKQAIGMRNIIAHDYGNVDYEIVWEVVSGEPFRILRTAVVAIIAELEPTTTGR